MKELIKQLEKATGPSRRMDSLIGRSLETMPTEPFKTKAPFSKLEGMYWVLGRKDTASGPTEERWSKNPPLYTSSLDAALTLVPVDTEQWDICMDTYPIACVGRGENGSKGANPAIALCIAALKARG